MDQVYQRSRYPVALLGRPIRTLHELTLLYGVLTGEYVEWDATTGSRQQALESLRLLYEITSDLWWQRAWTYQENYKGGEDMILLISHPPSWDQQKRDYEIFDDVPGELCIKSISFSHHVTTFCQTFRHAIPPTLGQDEQIQNILSKAGRFKVLLDESEPMTPAIVADVATRGITDPWDRLPIVANCCGYPIRLDVRELRLNRRSPALSMLTMCLLNGLILHNGSLRDGTSQRSSVFEITVSRFLKEHCFDKISSPQSRSSLTFNKGFRFPNVMLTEAGVRTKGHLWKLEAIIQTAAFNGQLPWADKPKGTLDLMSFRRLMRLFIELKSLNETELANIIEDYLHKDAIDNAPYQFGENYVYIMVMEVVGAIEQGRASRLGSLYELGESAVPCTAIFLWDDDRTVDLNNRPSFAFTAVQPRGDNANDTDHHVSLEVDLEMGKTNDSVRHLYIRRALPGLCFFGGRSRKPVLFPWPLALANVKP